MSRRASPPADGGGPAALRWIAAGALALGLHAGAAALMVRGAPPEPLAAGGGDAIAVELEPVEGEAAKPDEAQPAVPADEAATAAAAAAPAEASRATPQPVDPAPPTPDPPPPPEPPPHPPTGEAVPDVPAPPPPVDPPQPEAKPAEPPRPATLPVQASQASAASAADEDAAPAVQKLAAARETAWRGRLVAHLNRYRRFPPGVGSGTARVGFTIDGDGRVTAVAIVTGSGDAALDAAARALVQRASPFPAPPAGVAGPALSFVVPVHYDARRP